MLQSDLDIKNLKATASLPRLLELLGFFPVQHSDKEWYFQNVLTSTGSKPVFAVNREFNIWYDHGIGKGGNIIDFAMAYWKLTFRAALQKLSDYFPEAQMPEYGRLQTRRRHAVKIPHYQIDTVKPIGDNLQITDYLKSKAIYGVAESMLSVVYYYFEDEKGVRKCFCAVGWKNELGSWEVKSQNFTGTIGYKSITVMERNPFAVAIFHDCFNYLSWRKENADSTNSIIILNSVNMLESAIRKAKDFLEISVFFNRDDNGRLQSAELIQALPHAIDCSRIYEGYTDYNEMIVTKRQNTRKSFRQ